jgi:multidrug resistance efflux pump
MKLQETQEALDTLKAKNEGELAAADLQLEFAQVDLSKYQTEEKQVELNDKRGQIALAERDLKEAEEKLSYYRTFHKRGFISSEQLKAKEAEVDKARFSLAQSQSRLKIYERYMVPRQERTLQAKVDELKREHQKLKKTQVCAVNKAQSEISTSRCALTVEEQKLTLMQHQLALAEVKAPCDGILAAPLAEAQKSRPSAGAALQPSQAIFTMPHMEQLCIKVRLGETEMRKLQLNQTARVTIDSEDDLGCTGILEKIEFQADSVWTRTDAQPRDFVAYIKLCSKHPLEWTSLGQKARVEFTLETLQEALQLPTGAITEKDGKSYVMVMTHDGPTPRELRTGGTDGKHVEIRHGLEAGDKVLMNSRLKPGDEPGSARLTTELP